MSGPIRRVAIIGGGITGLSAAFELQHLQRQAGLPLECIVLESDHRVGGKIRTEHHEDFLIEAGPDSFHAESRNLLELARATGLGGELIHSGASQAYIYTRNALHAIPAGMVMGVPTKLLPFLKSRLLSPAGKLRVVLEAFRRHDTPTEDESVSQFFRRHFGSELVEQLVDPLFSAIYANRVDHLSARAILPRLMALQDGQRSLILGLRRTQRLHATRQPERVTARKRTPLVSLSRGMQSLPEAIVAQLAPSSAMTDTAVERIERVAGQYRLFLHARAPLDVDAVILATPSDVAAKLLDMRTDFKRLHESPPTSVANVVLGYRPDAIPAQPPGTGFVVSRQAACAITACTWSHLKWPHSTPQGHALLRCHVGRSDDDRLVAADDDAIVHSVMRDLKRIMGIDQPPAFYRVTRWRKAMPQYAVGHAEHVARLRHSVAERFPGVVLAGASYGGMGLSDCVRQGNEAAQATRACLFETPS